MTDEQQVARPSFPWLKTPVKVQRGAQTWTGTIEHARPERNKKGDVIGYRVKVLADAEAPIPGAIMTVAWADCEVVTP